MLAYKEHFDINISRNIICIENLINLSWGLCLYFNIFSIHFMYLFIDTCVCVCVCVYCTSQNIYNVVSDYWNSFFGGTYANIETYRDISKGVCHIQKIQGIQL